MVDYDIESIKEGMTECALLADASGFGGFAEKLRESARRLDTPMQLAIIGKISSSKSTLVNAILERDELMTTGEKEMTFNVGWLKYGKLDSDIIGNYKDGRGERKKSRKEFERLSIDSESEELRNISYIELFDDAEILKKINIIDTPGLDANRRIDSLNTLEFLEKVRPDAVLMLFTHAVAESTLDVVRDFNMGGNFNPLNAVGVLSKIDVLWQETIPRTDSALKIGEKMVAKRKKKNPELRKTLFDLYPVSALLFLAASTIRQEDIDDIRSAYGEAPDILPRLLNNVDKFLTDGSISLPKDKRCRLVGKMGVYGIRLVMDRLKENASPEAEEISSLFMKESGAERFLKTLYNHFGSRSQLIKMESVFQDLSQEISSIRSKVKKEDSASKLDRIEQKLTDLFCNLVHEHAEYEMLNDIYEGRLDLDEDDKEEFLHLCGEYGNSAPEKLGMAAGSSIESLLQKALERELYWRKAVALEPDPEEREWMNVILKSTARLRRQITEMKYHYASARAFLFNE